MRRSLQYCYELRASTNSGSRCPLKIRLEGSRTPIAAAALVVGLLAAAGSTTVTATSPLLVRRFVDFTVPQPGLSALCGFTVYRHVEGFVDAALFVAALGDPVREVATSPSLRITFLSPDTGTSVSFPGTGAAITEFGPNGAATVALDGFLALIREQGSAPLLLSVGRLVFTAEVIGTSSDGLPVTGPPQTLLFESGAEFGSITGVCRALAPEHRPVLRRA